MRIFTTCFFIIFFISCNTTQFNTASIQDDSNNLDEIKKYLELQERVESEEKEFENPHKLLEKDLFLALDLENEGFKKNGFKPLDKNIFESKIFEIFNIKTNSNNCNKVKITDSLITYFGKKLDGSIKTLNQNEFELQSITNNLFFSREYGFFTQMYLLKDLLIIEDENYKLIIPEKLIARNKYLLNDDKSLLPWLTSNDEFFMKSLLTDFGYTKDEELLHWIIKNNSFKQSSKDNTNGMEFGHILYSRNCQNKFKIHTEVFDVMESEMTPENTAYLDNLLEYVVYLSNVKNDADLTFGERSNIIAHVLYFGQNLANNKGYDTFKYRCMGFFYEHLDTNKEFQKEFEKGNYYGLINFKEMWEAAIIDGDAVALPGEE